MTDPTNDSNVFGPDPAECGPVSASFNSVTPPRTVEPYPEMGELFVFPGVKWDGESPLGLEVEVVQGATFYNPDAIARVRIFSEEEESHD